MSEGWHLWAVYVIIRDLATFYDASKKLQDLNRDFHCLRGFGASCLQAIGTYCMVLANGAQPGSIFGGELMIRGKKVAHILL